MKIKFDHEQKSTLKAIGSNTHVDELAEKLATISIDFMKGDKGKISELCELVTQRLTDEEILYVCSQKIHSTINQTLFEVALGNMSQSDNSLLN